MIHELTVMILRPANSINLFRLGPNDFGVENIFETYDELNLILEGDTSASKLPSIRIVAEKYNNKTRLAAVPIESGQFRWGGKFIYSIDTSYKRICMYPIPLYDRRDQSLLQIQL